MATLSFFIERHLNKHKYLIYVRYDHLGLKTLFSTNTKARIEELNWLLEVGKEKIKVNQPLNRNFIGYSRVNRDLIETYMKVQEAMYEAKKHGDLSIYKVKEIYGDWNNKSEIKTIVQGIDLIVKSYSNSLSSQTIKNYDKNLRRHIEGFNKLNKKDFGLMDLNSRFELDYKAYLTDVSGLSDGSIDNQIKYLKSLCAKLKKLGIDYNKSVESYERVYLDNEIVFLTYDELMCLCEAKLASTHLSEQKDVFVFNCFSGFRIGDLKRFNRDWIFDNRMNTTAGKSKGKIRIPILNEAREILEKYDYRLPVISDQKYNVAIHEFLQELGFDRVIEEKGLKPLWQVATSHTARKTFITYALNRLKLSISDVSLITGTTKETILKYYAGSNIDEVEQKIANLVADV